MATSIDLRGTRTVCVNEAYLAICDGDYCAAMALRQMQHIHDDGSEAQSLAEVRAGLATVTRAKVRDTSPGWFPKMAQELSDQMLGTYGRRFVQDALAYLVRRGYLESRTDPDLPSTLRTRQYRFNVEVVRAAIEDWKRNRSRHLSTEPDCRRTDVETPPLAGSYACQQKPTPPAGSVDQSSPLNSPETPSPAGSLAGGHILDPRSKKLEILKADLKTKEKSARALYAASGEKSEPQPPPMVATGTGPAPIPLQQSPPSSLEETLRTFPPGTGLPLTPAQISYALATHSETRIRALMKRVMHQHQAGQCDRPAAMLAKFLYSDAEIPAEDEQTTAQERRQEQDRRAELRTVQKSAYADVSPPAHPNTQHPTPNTQHRYAIPQVMSAEETRSYIAAIRDRLAGKLAMPPAGPVGGCTS